MNKAQRVFCEIVSKDLVNDPRFTYVYDMLGRFTPVKPIALDPNYNRNKYACGTCKTPFKQITLQSGLVINRLFCEKCGSEIDWDSADPVEELDG